MKGRGRPTRHTLRSDSCPAAGSCTICRLGLQVHPTKGTATGVTTLDLLGFRTNTIWRVLLLPPRRLEKVVGGAHSVLRAAAQHRRWIRLRALQRFRGVAVSCGSAVRLARFRWHALNLCLVGSAGRPQVRLTSAAMTNLSSWTGLATSPGVGRALWQQPVVGELTKNACGYGWGAVLNHLVPARGLFSILDQADHINVHDVKALDKKLDCFPALTGPGVLRLRLDSTLNVAVVKSMTTRSPRLMTVLTSISDKLPARGLRAEASWLSSVASAHADKLSRDKGSTDWRLDDAVFRTLDARWGPLTINRFTT